jgi:hypothetical protein
MNPAMVATAMLAGAEPQPGPVEPGKTVGQLGHGAKMTLTVDGAGKRTLEFTKPAPGSPGDGRFYPSTKGEPWPVS